MRTDVSHFNLSYWPWKSARVEKVGVTRPIIHTDPANQVEASDVVLHNLFSYFTRDTFLAIPLVCKRWRNFRTEALWKNRLLRDFDLDLSSLKKEPNVLLLYKQMFAAKNDIYRKSRYFDIKPENLVLPRRLFRTYRLEVFPIYVYRYFL